MSGRPKGNSREKKARISVRFTPEVPAQKGRKFRPLHTGSSGLVQRAEIPWNPIEIAKKTFKSLLHEGKTSLEEHFYQRKLANSS